MEAVWPRCRGNWVTQMMNIHSSSHINASVPLYKKMLYAKKHKKLLPLEITQFLLQHRNINVYMHIYFHKTNKKKKILQHPDQSFISGVIAVGYKLHCTIIHTIIKSISRGKKSITCIIHHKLKVRKHVYSCFHKDVSENALTFCWSFVDVFVEGLPTRPGNSFKFAVFHKDFLFWPSLLSLNVRILLWLSYTVFHYQKKL